MTYEVHYVDRDGKKQVDVIKDSFLRLCFGDGMAVFHGQLTIGRGGTPYYIPLVAYSTSSITKIVLGNDSAMPKNNNSVQTKSDKTYAVMHKDGTTQCAACQKHICIEDVYCKWCGAKVEGELTYDEVLDGKTPQAREALDMLTNYEGDNWNEYSY